MAFAGSSAAWQVAEPDIGGTGDPAAGCCEMGLELQRTGDKPANKQACGQALGRGTAQKGALPVGLGKATCWICKRAKGTWDQGQVAKAHTRPHAWSIQEQAEAGQVLTCPHMHPDLRPRNRGLEMYTWSVPLPGK